MGIIYWSIFSRRTRNLPQWYLPWLSEAFKLCYNVSWHQLTVKQFKKPLDEFHLKSHVALKKKLGYWLDLLFIRRACQMILEQNSQLLKNGRKKNPKHSTSWRQAAASLVMIHKNHKLSPTLDCVNCRVPLETMPLCRLWYEHSKKMLTVPAQCARLCAVFAQPVLAKIMFSVV